MTTKNGEDAVSIPTPRTTEEMQRSAKLGARDMEGAWMQMIDFARQLERELAEAKDADFLEAAHKWQERAEKAEAALLARPSLAAQPVAWMEYDNLGNCLGPCLKSDGFWKDTRPLFEHLAPPSLAKQVGHGLSTEQIEEFRKEHHIPGPDLEQWAIDEDRVLHALCDYAEAP